MCGINGLIQFNQQLNLKEIEQIIHNMNDKIIHRGPDDDGIFVSENVGLGMRRLSIIDLSTGQQPIYNMQKDKVIVFNGEIYNYQGIRERLINKGYCFATQSDTEVVLNAYEEYGTNCLDMFDGMFAFAIYDMKNKQIVIARDRAGEKPLYYSNSNGVIVFGSELKSLVKSGFVNKEINQTALNQYLQLTYIPAPLTIYENVYKLDAGNYMIIKETGEFYQNSYWQVKSEEGCLIRDYDRCKKLLRDALFSSVEKRMISDVPVGSFLSGGIDSTIITGIMSRLSSKPIDTFTIGFYNKDYDESERAKIASKHLNTNHHIHFLDFEEVFHHIDYILGNLDEPFADSSAIPTYIVSKYASEFVKVVLTGDAGDELFAGYSKYLIGHYADKYNKIPSFIRKNLFENIIYRIPDTHSLTRKVRKVIENSQIDLFSQRKNLMLLGFKENELSLLLKTKDNQNDSLAFIHEYYSEFTGITDELSQTLYTDFKVVLEGDMLVKVDRMSMLNSIETRVPLLNKEVVELSYQIPSEYKINSKGQKLILKDTFKDLIPTQLFNASKKGFGIPLDEWFRGPLRTQLEQLLSKEYIEEQGIFNYEYITQLLNEHFSGSKNRKSELWVLFVFQYWYKNEMQ